MTEKHNLIEPKNWPRQYTLEEDGEPQGRPIKAFDHDSSDEFIELDKTDRPMQTEKEKRTCFNLTFTEFQLIILLILAVIIIIMMAIVVVILRATSFYYCTDAKCAKQAGVTVAVMNLSADPCNDFYNYACGNWVKKFTPEPGVGKSSQFHRASEKILKQSYFILNKGESIVNGQNSTSAQKMNIFYKSCMNMNAREALGATPILKLINETGGSTLTPSAPLQASWDFLTIIPKTIQLGARVLLYVSTDINPHKTSEHVAELTHGKGFFSRGELLSTNTKYKKAFIQYGRTITVLLGGSKSSATDVKLENVWNLQLDLAKHQMTKLQSRNPLLTNTILTVKHIHENILNKRLDLYKFMKSLYKRDFKGTDKILVNDINYLKYIASILPSLNKETVSNFIVLKLAKQFGSKLTPDFQNAAATLHKVITGSAISLPAWKVCVGLSRTYFPLQLTALYVQEYFNKQNKAQVIDMVKWIKHGLIQAITNAKWMDEHTKKIALAKAKNIMASIAYPDDLFNVLHLDSKLKDLHLHTTEFFTNYVSTRKLRKEISLKKLDHPVDRKAFEMTPLIANAYYSSTTVTVKVLAGLIQYPFFENYYFNKSNFGALGSVIGHELNHAFDSRGRHYGIHGNMKNWWSNETEKRFNAKTQCFVDQYSKYKFHGMHNRGKITVAENMADNGGIQVSLLAYKAFKEKHIDITGYLPGLKLRNLQLFFLSFAQMYCGYYTEAYAKHAVMTDVHSPYPNRVLGTLSNQKEFAEAFKCPANSKYNPAHRCVIW